MPGDRQKCPPFRRSLDAGFGSKAALLRQYLSVVLENERVIFLWTHRDFSLPDRKLICSDGVRCNVKEQYSLHRSYRGAVLKAVSLLAIDISPMHVFYRFYYFLVTVVPFCDSNEHCFFVSLLITAMLFVVVLLLYLLVPVMLFCYSVVILFATAMLFCGSFITFFTYFCHAFL